MRGVLAILLVADLGSRAAATPALPPNDSVLRGLPLTPQMFGAACDSDGTTGNGHDDTAAIQAAVTTAIALGSTLRIPGKAAGQMCRTTASIDTIDRITIDGDYCEPYTDNSQAHVTPGPGSWLFFDHAGPGLFTNGHNPSGLVFKNFCTMRPQPALPPSFTTAWTPGAFDFDFSIGGDDSLIEHVVTLNPTNAVFVQGRFTIRDLRGNPYHTGIEAYQSYDLPRIEDVHFWPFETINTSVAYYQHRNFEALQLYRVDNPMISNFFAIGAKVCVHFMSNSHGITSKAKFANLDCDLFGRTGILSDADDVTAQIANYTGQGADPDPGEPSTTSVNGVAIMARNNHFTFSGARVTNVGADAFVMAGAGSWAILHGYSAEKWGINTGACAVSAKSGATIDVDPSFYAATGAHGRCLFGGDGTVNSYTVSKVN